MDDAAVRCWPDRPYPHLNTVSARQMCYIVASSSISAGCLSGQTGGWCLILLPTCFAAACRMVSDAVAGLGRLDIAINNAGKDTVPVTTTHSVQKQQLLVQGASRNTHNYQL